MDRPQSLLVDAAGDAAGGCVIKAPFPWFGGKSRAASHLAIDLTPPPPEITGRLAADQDAAFRMFKPEDPTQ